VKLLLLQRVNVQLIEMRSLAYLLKDLKLFLLMTIFPILPFRREKWRNGEEIVITAKT